MFFQRMGPRPASISDAVFRELLDALYGTQVPIVFAGASQAIAGAIIMRQTGDIVVTGALTALGIVVAIARALGVWSFRRRVAEGTPLGAAEARRRGLHYMVGTAATAALLGLFAGRSLLLDDPTCPIMALGIGFGFGAGVVARLSLLPVLAAVDMAVLGLPAIAVALSRMDAPHAGLAVLIAIYLVGGFEMVRLTFNSTVNQILLKQQFEQLSRIDPMTGLFNRSVLSSDLPGLIAAHDRKMVVVYAIDLDHFKAANDRFGHPVGDALLKQVAGRLISLSGPGGMVIRMGGDEFVLVEPAHSRQEVASLAERLVEIVRAPYRVGGHDIVIGASVGVALSPDHGRSVDSLLVRADQALYLAKVARGGYVFADDLATANAAVDQPIARQHAA